MEKLQERRLLVGDPRDAQGLTGFALGEAEEFLRRDFSLGGGDRVAVGVDAGVTEEIVDALQYFFRDGVLEVFGLVVHFGPVEAENFHEEELDEAVPAEDVERELLTGAGEAN